MIYKRCIFLRVKSKQHVLAIYGHHQVLCQLRFHYMNCVICVMMWRSQHRIIVEIYLCTGGYCCVVSLRWYRVSHLGACRVSSGVSNWMSSSLSSRRVSTSQRNSRNLYSEILIDIKPDDGHISPKHVVLI